MKQPDSLKKKEKQIESLLRDPPADEALDRHPADKLIAIGLIVLATLGMLVYIGKSFVGAYHVAMQPSPAVTQQSAPPPPPAH